MLYAYFFLPLAVLLYYLTPRRLRSLALTALSCAFLFLWQAELLLWALGAAVCLYFCAAQVYHSSYNVVRRRAGLALGLLVCAGAFAGYIARAEADALDVVILAAVLLSGISYTIDLYRGGSARLYGFSAFLAYCLFFGKLCYGPLMGADEFALRLSQAKASSRRMGLGLILLFTGLSQLLLPLEWLMAAGRHLKGSPAEQQCLIILIMLIILTALEWHFRLVGFSNIAQGTGLLFGIDLPRNHAHPLGAGSFKGYFNRFLITQSLYAKAYIQPGLTERGENGGALPVVACAVFTGIWLGIPGGALWGAVFGVVIWIEQLKHRRGKKSGAGPLWRMAVSLLGAFSFVLFIPGSGKDYFKELGGLLRVAAGMPTYSDLGLYMLVAFSPVILMLTLLSTRLLQAISEFLKTRAPFIYNGAVLLWGLGVMALSFVAMVGNGGWNV